VSSIQNSPEKTTPVAESQFPISAHPQAAFRWLLFLFRSVLSVALIGGAVVLFFVLGTSQPPQPKSDTTAGMPVVETTEVTAPESNIELEVDGVVVPLREISIATEVQGRIQFKAENCRIGRFVEQGDLLIRIDPGDYKIEIQRLEQDLEQAAGSLEELEADLLSNKNEIALDRDEVVIRQRELKRYEEIDDPGVFAKTEVDTAKRNELTARAALQTSIDKSATLASRRRRLEGAREIVKSRLEQARLDLSRTEIHAPISGIITQDFVEQDGYGQKGMTLIAIQDTHNMEVKCSLHERQEQLLWLSA
jgi:multidrug efflux pump subunit AcrA (membrane-fusion protein)